MQKQKVYLICDYTDEKAASMNGTPNIGVEHMGHCGGRIVNENGIEIGSHHSSTFGFLRMDLKAKLDNPDDYEIIDLIGKEVPDEFKQEEP